MKAGTNIVLVQTIVSVRSRFGGAAIQIASFAASMIYTTATETAEKRENNARSITHFTG
jgi:hypothetical protein